MLPLNRRVIHTVDATGFCIQCGETAEWLVEHGHLIDDRRKLADIEVDLGDPSDIEPDLGLIGRALNRRSNA